MGIDPNKLKTAKQINTEAGVPDIYEVDILGQENERVPNLDSLLTLLAMRFSMLKYKFKIDKNKKIIKWWK